MYSPSSEQSRIENIKHYISRIGTNISQNEDILKHKQKQQQISIINKTPNNISVSISLQEKDSEKRFGNASTNYHSRREQINVRRQKSQVRRELRKEMIEGREQADYVVEHMRYSPSHYQHQENLKPLAQSVFLSSTLIPRQQKQFNRIHQNPNIKIEETPTKQIEREKQTFSPLNWSVSFSNMTNSQFTEKRPKNRIQNELVKVQIGKPTQTYYENLSKRTQLKKQLDLKRDQLFKSRNNSDEGYSKLYYSRKSAGTQMRQKQDRKKDQFVENKQHFIKDLGNTISYFQNSRHKVGDRKADRQNSYSQRSKKKSPQKKKFVKTFRQNPANRHRYCTERDNIHTSKSKSSRSRSISQSAIEVSERLYSSRTKSKKPCQHYLRHNLENQLQKLKQMVQKNPMAKKYLRQIEINDLFVEIERQKVPEYLWNQKIVQVTYQKMIRISPQKTKLDKYYD